MSTYKEASPEIMRELLKKAPLEFWTGSEEDIEQIYKLEESAWNTLLRFSKEELTTIAKNFSQTQLLIRNPIDSQVLATLSAMRFYDQDHFTWDSLAGGRLGTNQSNYSRTYKEKGNAVCGMSVSVNPDYGGYGLGTKLLQGFTILAESIPEIEKIYILIRPINYGPEKMNCLRRGIPLIGFEEYCKEQGDLWLRTAKKAGLNPTVVVDNSMIVPLSKEDLIYHMTHDKNEWVRTSWGIELSQTGSIYLTEKSSPDEPLEKVIERQPKIEHSVTPVSLMSIKDVENLDLNRLAAYYGEQNQKVEKKVR